MTPLLEWTLVSFIIVLAVAVVFLTIYIVKFIQEATLTMANIKEITETTKKELEPALKSVNNILLTVSNISSTTNRHLETVRKILTTLITASCLVFSKAKGNGFISGLLSGFNLFGKKRR